MAFHRFTNNFNGGEWTPFLDGRSDLAKYDTACKTLENVRPLPYGGARIRGGLKYIASSKNMNDVCRLIPFNFSTNTRFVIEMGDKYLRFYSNGVQVQTSPGVPYELVSPFVSGAVFVVQFKQINDIMYLVHPSYPPQKLSRITDTNWTIAPVDWTYPPLREENVTATTITPDGTTGSITLTSSAPVFQAGHGGAYFELRYLREGDAEEIDISGSAGTVTGTGLTIKGDWSLVTTERWYGTLLVERSTDGGTSWEVVRKFLSASDYNASATGNEATECILRLNYTATGDPYGAGVWAGTAPTAYVKAKAKLASSEAYASGLVQLTSYVNSTEMDATVIETLPSTAATTLWSEGAWSTVRGYPAAVGLYEQRVFYGATTERPTRFWGSVTGDFDNFRYGSDDDAAISQDIAVTQSNPIKWIESLQRIQIGTGGGEFSAAAGNSDEPLTPSNMAVRGQSYYGSGSFQPVLANDAVIFMQRQNTRLREMSYSIERDGYVSPDLTLLAEHITAPGVSQLGFARQPDPLILATVGTHLGVMTYNREQDIIAWARYTTDGDIESVCSIYGDTADEIWVVVRRIINGQQKRYIERFANESDNKLTCRLLDSYVDGTLTNPFSGTISGLGHLVAKTVRLVVAGAVIGDYVVSGSGTITVDTAQVPTLGPYVVGLPYQAIIQPMSLDIVLQNGPSQGRVRRVSELTIRFYESLGCKFGPSMDRLETLQFRTSTSLMDGSPDTFTGDKQVKFPLGQEIKADVFVVQDQPLPFTVLGIAVKAEVFD